MPLLDMHCAVHLAESTFFPATSVSSHHVHTKIEDNLPTFITLSYLVSNLFVRNLRTVYTEEELKKISMFYNNDYFFIKI